MHKKKRIASIKLLLAIAKGGRPTDALTAGVTVIALEEDPVSALVWYRVPLDSFDALDSDDLPTIRERLVEEVERLLTEAEKSKKKDKK